MLTIVTELLCCAFHPDGQFFAAGGADGQIRLWTITTGEIAGTFETDAPVQSLSFSENGTTLASAGKGQSTVSIWDLRKMSTISTLDVGAAVEQIKWDYSGQFLAVVGAGCITVQQQTKKGKSLKWSEPLRKAIDAVDIAWGPEAKSFACLTPTGTVSVFGS